MNRAIREALGHEGTGIAFRFSRGAREPGDRVIFEKTPRPGFGPQRLHGHGARRRAGGDAFELDDGRMVRFDPKAYPYLDCGWATTHETQGRGDPLVHRDACEERRRSIGARRADALRDGASRTRGSRAPSCSTIPIAGVAGSLRPKDDALLFEEIVRRTGGPDTFWAKSGRTALATESDPLRAEHRAEMRPTRQPARAKTIAQPLPTRPHPTMATASDICASASPTRRRANEEQGAEAASWRCTVLLSRASLQITIARQSRWLSNLYYQILHTNEKLLRTVLTAMEASNMAFADDPRRLARGDSRRG